MRVRGAVLCLPLSVCLSLSLSYSLSLSHTHTHICACIMHHQTSVPYILYNIYIKNLYIHPEASLSYPYFLLPPFPSVTISLPLPSFFLLYYQNVVTTL